MPLKSVLSIDLNESDDQIKLKEKTGRARSIRLGKFRDRTRGFLLSDGNVYPLVVAKAGKDSQSYTIVHSSKAEKKKYKSSILHGLFIMTTESSQLHFFI